MGSVCSVFVFFSCSIFFAGWFLSRRSGKTVMHVFSLPGKTIEPRKTLNTWPYFPLNPGCLIRILMSWFYCNPYITV